MVMADNDNDDDDDDNGPYGLQSYGYGLHTYHFGQPCISRITLIYIKYNLAIESWTRYRTV